MSMHELGQHVGENIRRLRELQGLTQLAAARLAGIPRATLAHLETGAGNPTLAVMARVAAAFHVSLEELVARPKSEVRRYASAELTVLRRGAASIRKLLPDPIPGVEVDRFSLPAGARLIGVPHLAGTREYLACERGQLQLTASGEVFELEAGDVCVFRGDQRHSYFNRGRTEVTAYSVVLLAR